MAAQVGGLSRARGRRPIRLGAAYLRAIAKLEALPQNQSGVDKSWVERTIRSWRELCRNAVQGVEIPVARLAHIVESKRRAGRDKDRLFFVTHAEAIRDLLGSQRDEIPGARRPRGKGRGRDRRRKPEPPQ